MPIIFGWNNQKVKEFGPVHKHACSNCGNISFWHLYIITTYFDLFFIPIIPYLIRRFIACPICDNSIELSKEDFEYYKNFTILNSALNQGSISKVEYKKLLTDLLTSKNNIIS